MEKEKNQEKEKKKGKKGNLATACFFSLFLYIIVCMYARIYMFVSMCLSVYLTFTILNTVRNIGNPEI